MKNLSGWGKLTGAYEMIAGVTGIFSAVPALFRPATSGHEMAYYTLGVFLILFSVLSFFAGIKLLQGTVLGLRTSYLVQIIQLPSLILKGLHFQLFILAGITIGINSAQEFMLHYYAGARLFLAFGEIDFAFIGINILPLMVIFLLMRAFKRDS